MKAISKYSIGIRFGLIAGILYMLLLFFRFKFFSSVPTGFFLFTLASYCLILFSFLFAGIARKKELGGYADVREIFQSIFIAILITEFIYVVFILIYMKYIDPDFMNRFKTSSLAYFHQLGFEEKDINMRMQGIESLSDQVKPAGLLKGFGTAVVIDSIFGFIFAFILRKKMPATVEPKL